MRSFTELKNDTAVLTQRSADSDYLTKIGVWLNFAQTFLANIYDYYNELFDIHNFTTVSGTESYYMPQRFDKPLRIYDITNDKKLNMDTETEYFDGNISNIVDATLGKPDFARIAGVIGVQRQISSSGATVDALSSTTGDQNTVIRVEGYIDSSLTIIGGESITLGTPSTTAVAGTRTFYKILHVSKSQDTTGYISLRDSSANVLTNLSPTARVARHKILNLGLIPNAAISMRVLFKRMVNKMVNDYDYPFIECDDFLTFYAASLALAQDKETVERANFFLNKANEAAKAILSNQNSKLGPDFQHKITNAFAQAHRV